MVISFSGSPKMEIGADDPWRFLGAVSGDVLPESECVKVEPRFAVHFDVRCVVEARDPIKGIRSHHRKDARWMGKQPSDGHGCIIYTVGLADVLQSCV